MGVGVRCSQSLEVSVPLPMMYTKFTPLLQSCLMKESFIVQHNDCDRKEISQLNVLFGST